MQMNTDKEEKKPTIPLSTVTNIVSSTVDDSVHISKSFLRLMQECGNAFIGQLAVQIAMQAEKDKVKTVGETQVVNALSALGFDEMKEEVIKRVQTEKTIEKKGKSQRKRLLEVDEESVTKMLKLNE